MMWYAVLVLAGWCSLAGSFDLVILHTNDVHSRIEETDVGGNPCPPDVECFGGVARRHTVIQQIRSQHDNVLLLDGGDQFQGTVWFNFYEGNATLHFMNMLGYDTMALGNHEFDNGVSGLMTFLENAAFDTLSCNIDSTEREDHDVLTEHIRPYVIKEFAGDVSVAIIGYITQDTPILVDPEGIEGLSFDAEIASLQLQVDALKAMDPPVDVIIALGHSGHEIDKQIAAQVTDLDLVVGGHTDTFLYTGVPPSIEEPVDDYPAMVEGKSGWEVPVLQAYAFGKYLGYLELEFDDSGNLVSYTGQPILLDETYEQDEAVLAEVQEWLEPLEEVMSEYVGETIVFLDGSKEACRVTECNMGNLLADAVIHRATLVEDIPLPPGAWVPASVSFWNGGGIRSSLPIGNVTMEGIYQVQPFPNVLDYMVVTGDTLWEALEHSISQYENPDPSGRFLQISGIIVTYDPSQSVGSRVVSVQILCHICDVPTYNDLVLDEEYPIITSDFILNGGDGYEMFQKHEDTRIHTSILASEALELQIARLTPVTQGLEQRIRYVEQPPDNSHANALHHTNSCMLAYVLTAAIGLLQSYLC